MRKYLFIAAGITTLVAGFAASSGPALASWAESAQGNAVHSGSNQSLWHSERNGMHSAYRSGRGSWSQGYSAYGAYNGRMNDGMGYGMGDGAYGRGGYQGGYSRY